MPSSRPDPSPPAATASPVVLVTGAARRLGLATALELARAGWSVALHHHRSAADEALAAIGATGAKAEAFAADLGDEAACRALVPAVIRHFGRLDAVVNNASIFRYDDAASFSYAAMDAHWRANTAPAIVLAQALHVHLIGRGACGCVVNILDQKLWNPNPDYLSYTLSKAALEAATQLLARALAPALRVCGVAPGVTLPTEGTMSDELFQATHTMTPLQRSSTSGDIARAVRFMIESPAVTGTTLLVDGGQHLQPQPRDVAFMQDAKHPARENPNP